MEDDGSKQHDRLFRYTFERPEVAEGELRSVLPAAVVEALDRARPELPRLCQALIPCYTDPVANLTITVDAEVLKRARLRALAQGTSVNAILAERLEAFAGQPDNQAVARSLIALAKENTQSARRPGRRLSRDELHER